MSSTPSHWPSTCHGICAYRHRAWHAHPTRKTQASVPKACSRHLLLQDSRGANSQPAGGRTSGPDARAAAAWQHPTGEYQEKGPGHPHGVQHSCSCSLEGLRLSPTGTADTPCLATVPQRALLPYGRDTLPGRPRHVRKPTGTKLARWRQGTGRRFLEAPAPAAASQSLPPWRSAGGDLVDIS